MRFSERTQWEPGQNEWAEALHARRRSGSELFDLTVSNPTQCGLSPDAATALLPLGAPEALRYSPDPFGMPHARRAVCSYYRDHGIDVDPERVCLTTSTSEAYSFLFRLLCDPGDEVLIAQPSYPLFDLLAQIDDVKLRPYPLIYEPGAGAEGRWWIDLHALAAAVTPRTRAVVLVHPNNPTGNYASADERFALQTLCAERQLSLIVDEVFLDFALPDTPATPFSFAQAQDQCLCFVLSGISKVCAMPQMKLSWIAASGPESWVSEALQRLEIVADTFLSVNAPVQYALSPWLAARSSSQEAIRARCVCNLAALDARLPGTLAGRLATEGGWTVVLRVPSHVEGESFTMAAMERGVVVQPGSFYGLSAGYCVLSLLTTPEVWDKGLAKLPIEG